MDYKKLTAKKERLDKQRPLPPELIQNLEEWFNIELTYTSNALEGNTLTRQETALVVEKGLTVGGKSLREHLEATNHAAALNWIKDLPAKRLQDLTQKDILQIHALILKSIDDTNAGYFRRVAVRIAGSQTVLPNPLKVPELMQQLLTWLHSKHKEHPVEIAALAHYKLVTIHPFVDGNGRTARLLMNLILMMYGYPPAIIRKQERLAYLNALEKAQLGGSLDDYLALISQAENRSLDIYLNALKGEATETEVKLLKTGELAQATGVTNSTVRHWSKEGLLDIADTTPSGYQLYDPKMIKQIEKIQQLKEQRYTLAEIKDALYSTVD